MGKRNKRKGKKDNRKICIRAGCNNHAKDDSNWCGLHDGSKAKKLSGTTTTASTYKSCHTGNVLIGNPQGVNLYCGGSSRNGGWWRMIPYPQLAIGPDEIVLKKGPQPIDPRWATAKSAGYVSEPLPIILALDWPDFGVPRGLDQQELPREFWLDLVSDILERGLTTVSLQCMGGHGRTGIQACILLHLLTPEEERTWVDVAGLLAHLHDVYCDQAVEGDNQAQYIARMCDIPAGDYKLHHYRAGGGTSWGWGSVGGYDWYKSGKSQSWCAVCKKMCPSHTVLMTNGKMTCDDCYNQMTAKYTEANAALSDTDDDDEDSLPLTMCKCTECGDEIDWDAEGSDCHRCHVGVYELTDEGKAALMDAEIDSAIAIIDDSVDWEMGQDGGQFV